MQLYVLFNPYELDAINTVLSSIDNLALPSLDTPYDEFPSTLELVKFNSPLFCIAVAFVVILVFTLLILTFAEIIPKTIGSKFWRKLTIPASNVIRCFIFLLFPLVYVLEKLTHLISNKSTQVSVSREEVSAMVTVGAEEGCLRKKKTR